MKQLQHLKQCKTQAENNYNTYNDYQLKLIDVQSENILAVLNYCEILRQELSELHDKISENSQNIELLNQHIKDCISRTDQLDNSVQTNKNQINDLLNQNATVNGKFSQIEEKLTRVNKHIEKFNKDSYLTTSSFNEFKKKPFEMLTGHYVFELEKESCLEQIRLFKEKNEDVIIKTQEIFQSEKSGFFRTEIAVRLPQLLSNFTTLKQNIIDKVLPVRDYYSQLSRIIYIYTTEEQLNKKKNELNNVGKESIDTKQITKNQINNQIKARIARSKFLIQSFSLLPDINVLFNFKPERWVREQFLSFADEFLIEYQKRQLDNDEEQLNEALEIINNALSKANIEYTKIVLGHTIFDSKIHIARTTTNTPTFPNNAISSVIRNGFRLINGNVIQQPEVIVNRRM